MDPNKEPSPMTKAERDSELNSNTGGTPREAQVGQGDMDVMFHARSQNPRQSTSCLQRQREPRPLGPELRPGRSGEPASENHYPAGSSQSTSNAKLNSNGDDSATPCSSKSIQIANNGLEQNNVPHSACKPEVDKEGSQVKAQPVSTSQTGDRENVRENRKRPSSLKLNRPNMEDDSSSLSDYSLGSEDGCIYTYRGGEHLADLPSSFFSLDMGLPADRLALPNYAAPQGAANGREGSRASSPDMDFLEMDFDPGPSNEADSGEESTNGADLDVDMEMPEENQPMELPAPVPAEASNKPVTGGSDQSNNEPNLNKPSTSRGSSYARPSTSRGATSSSHSRPSENVPHIVYGPYITHINVRGEPILVRRTTSHSVGPVSVHLFNGELIRRLPPEYFPDAPENRLPDNPYPLSQINLTFSQPDFHALLPAAVYHTMKAQTLITEKKAYEELVAANEIPSDPLASTSTVSCAETPRSMVWTEEAACDRQVTQIGTSACGATAVVNVFNALGVPVDIERINTSVGTSARANSATVPRYILSRAIAGCTAAGLINGIQIASGGLVTARFFPTYPERAMSLSHFLADWISLGAVPILTLNLQSGYDTQVQVPDAWHHQMVFGVSPQGIYLANPLECLRENVLWSRLVSPSVLLIRVRDIVSRFSEDTDLTPLMYVPDARFHTFNVFGQVANVLRESRMPWRQDSNPRTQHIRIPAAYQAGITIAVLTGTEAHRRLMSATQPPLLDSRCSDDVDDPA